MCSLKDAETGQRGFIITGLPEYLEPYNLSVGVFAARLESLRLLTAGDDRQQQRIVALTQLLGQSMDQLRMLVGQAKAEEAENLKSYATQSAADIRSTLQAMLLGGTLGALALLLFFVCLRWELAGRQHAEKELRHSTWQYHLLFDSIDEAFCIVELIFDDGKAPVDYRFLEVNRAFEK